MLNERISTSLSPDEMVSTLQELGCDVEGYATLRRFACERCQFLMEITETENPPVECQACGHDFKACPQDLSERGTSDVIRMELLAVRPDMFDPAGLARTLRGYLEEFIGPVVYPIDPPQVTVTIQAELLDEHNEAYRPIGCAVVRGAELDEDRIKVLMKLQENLHWAMGRDRKRASIGVYDLGSLDPNRGIRYGLCEPEALCFVPLGRTEEMTPKRILEEHVKGRDYAHLLAGRESYPLLSGFCSDGSDLVMAFIPIINSEATKVTQQSQDLFIDVTGLEERLVSKILHTILTSILELCPGSRAEYVTLQAGDRFWKQTPNLEPQEMMLEARFPARRIGVEIPDVDVPRYLGRMGHGVEELGEGKLLVKVPAYRNDILHPVDLVEDVAIAYGYHHITPSLVPTFTVGVETARGAMMNRARQVLTGLGYLEVLTLILSNEGDQFLKLRRSNHDNYVKLLHPISLEQTMVRTSLLPGLLDTLSVNVDQSLPQYIFEVGRVSFLDATTEVGAREELRVTAAFVGSRADFAQIKAVMEALVRELGVAVPVIIRAVAPTDESSETFIPGRGAVLEAYGQTLAVFGELHPAVLEAFHLAYPVAFLEMDLEPLLTS